MKDNSRAISRQSLLFLNPPFCKTTAITSAMPQRHREIGEKRAIGICGKDDIVI
jgi:hypothetical protein